MFPGYLNISAADFGKGQPLKVRVKGDMAALEQDLAEVMFDEFREPRYAPPALLKRMVLAGHLGRKTGRGFYTYER